jgi:hypothetical protein
LGGTHEVSLKKIEREPEHKPKYPQPLQFSGCRLEFLHRVFLPCAQQELLSRNYTVTLHGLSIPENLELLNFEFAPRS